MSGQHERDYVHHFTDDDTVRVRFTTERDTVLRFTVQYDVWIDGHVHPVVRYDNAHGFAHRDLLDWNGDVIDKQALPAHWTTNQALTHAEWEIKTNWPLHRDAFMRRKI